MHPVLRWTVPDRVGDDIVPALRGGVVLDGDRADWSGSMQCVRWWQVSDGRWYHNMHELQCWDVRDRDWSHHIVDVCSVCCWDISKCCRVVELLWLWCRIILLCQQCLFIGRMQGVRVRKVSNRSGEVIVHSLCARTLQWGERIFNLHCVCGWAVSDRYRGERLPGLHGWHVFERHWRVRRERVRAVRCRAV
jgi:hypothetical protein